MTVSESSSSNKEAFCHTGARQSGRWRHSSRFFLIRVSLSSWNVVISSLQHSVRCKEPNRAALSKKNRGTSQSKNDWWTQLLSANPLRAQRALVDLLIWVARLHDRRLRPRDVRPVFLLTESSIPTLPSNFRIELLLFVLRLLSVNIFGGSATFCA